MHECREHRDAQERPLFALRIDNFSGREWALPVAPVGRGPGAKRIKRKVRWTFLPLSGFAREGEPRLSSKARTAKRRKVRVKKATDGLFQQPASVEPIDVAHLQAICKSGTCILNLLS